MKFVGAFLAFLKKPVIALQHICYLFRQPTSVHGRSVDTTVYFCYKIVIVASLKPHQHHPHCAWTSTTDQGQIVCHFSHVPPSRRCRRVLQCLFHHYTDYPPWAATYSAHCSTVHFLMSLLKWKQEMSLPVIRSPKATSYCFSLCLRYGTASVTKNYCQWWSVMDQTKTSFVNQLKLQN